MCGMPLCLCVSFGVTAGAPLCNKSLCLWMLGYSGIGRATSLALARCGAKVVAVTRTQADLNSLLQEVYPPNTHTHAHKNPLSSICGSPVPNLCLPSSVLPFSSTLIIIWGVYSPPHPIYRLSSLTIIFHTGSPLNNSVYMHAKGAYFDLKL